MKDQIIDLIKTKTPEDAANEILKLIVNPVISESVSSYEEDDEEQFDDDERYNWEDDLEEQKEREDEERAERDFNCTCGAWKFNKEKTKVFHVADCVCGAE